MKLLIVNPNISESVTSLIAQEAQRAAGPGVTFTTLTAPFGVAYIESRAEAAIGAYATLELLAEHYPGHDAAIVAAFGDPGLMAAKEILPIPVVGLTEAALMTACMHGGRFSIISISKRITAWYRETVDAYGLLGRLASLRNLEQAFPDIGNVQEDRAEQLLALCDAAVKEDGADVLILAGAPLAGLARKVADRLPVPVVDGVTSAVRQAMTMAAIGGQAREGSFAPPPMKGSQGLSPALAKLVGRQDV
jgi:Asp/Glu/hydantoin racemase